MVDTRFSVSLHIMVILAYNSEELVNSDYLAKTLKTNPTFIRKLVANLVQAKLVESFRGKGGGIKMARPPQSITLKDIYIASTEEKTLLAGHKKPVVKSCVVSCSMDNIFCDIVSDIEKSTQAYLSKRNLADLLKKVN